MENHTTETPIEPASTDAPRRGRPPLASRATETRRARRMQPGSLLASGIKLAVDENKLDRREFKYRWVNDTGNRVEAMKKRDWDVATIDETTHDANVGRNENGSGQKAILMRKYKDWYDADAARKQEPIDAMEQSIREGRNHSSEAELRDGTYTPGSGNKIQR